MILIINYNAIYIIYFIYSGLNCKLLFYLYFLNNKNIIEKYILENIIKKLYKKLNENKINKLKYYISNNRNTKKNLD